MVMVVVKLWNFILLHFMEEVILEKMCLFRKEKKELLTLKSSQGALGINVK